MPSRTKDIATGALGIIFFGGVFAFALTEPLTDAGRTAVWLASLLGAVVAVALVVRRLRITTSPAPSGFTAVDGLLTAAAVFAGGALARSGGTLTGVLVGAACGFFVAASLAYMVFGDPSSRRA